MGTSARPAFEVDDFRNADDLAKTLRAIDQDDARYEGGKLDRWWEEVICWCDSLPKTNSKFAPEK